MKDIKTLGPADLRALEGYAINELMKVQAIMMESKPSELPELEAKKAKTENRLKEIEEELKTWLYGSS